jgi:hypothetical protein
MWISNTKPIQWLPEKDKIPMDNPLRGTETKPEPINNTDYYLESHLILYTCGLSELQQLVTETDEPRLLQLITEFKNNSPFWYDCPESSTSTASIVFQELTTFAHSTKLVKLCPDRLKELIAEIHALTI